MKLTIYGPPRTKKNHGYVALTTDRVGRRRRHHMPSKAWKEWRDGCRIEYADGSWPHTVVERPVNCRAIFYRDAARGDAVGYYQGLADLLEHHSIVANDKWIVSWDGSRLRKDKDNPRVEVELVAMEES